MKIQMTCSFLMGLALMSSCQPSIPCEDEIICETYIHRYGVPLNSQDWSARGQHGQVVSTRKDGVLITQTYDAGILHGTCTYTYPYKENLSKTELYEQGILTEECFYHLNGVLVKKVVHSNDQSYTSECWDEVGAPQCRENYENELLKAGDYFDENNTIESRVDNFNGLRTVRDEHGQLLSVDTIENGLMISRTTYHPNGSPATFTPYINHVIHGERKTYLAGGEPATIEQWQNGKQHGLTIEFEQGEKVAEVVYVNGYKHGVERHYRNGSTIAKETYWVRGYRQGPCHTYVGETILVDWYYGDRLVNKNTYDVLKSQE